MYLISAVVAAAVLLVFWPAPEPEQCALCGGLKTHAPCIVNLATGEVGELEIFQPHRRLVGEIAEDQPGGIFAFLPCAGLRAVQDTNARTCEVEIPESRKGLNSKYFCRDCRKLLSGMKGYALTDRYHLEEIQVYPIRDGAVYDIRNYTVSIQWDPEHNVFNVVNFGNLT